MAKSKQEKGATVISIGFVPEKELKKMKMKKGGSACSKCGGKKCNCAKMYGGGMASGKQHNYAAGGMVQDNLKAVPAGNKGLKKLPSDVRNKMGYMNKGGYSCGSRKK